MVHRSDLVPLTVAPDPKSMSRVNIEVPDEVLISPETDSESFAHELVLVAAVKLFEMGKLSSGRAAERAGLPRVEFLLELRRYNVSPFRVTQEELHQDVRSSLPERWKSID